jgi:hypothetical protein
MIFIYVCLTRIIVELSTRFETWITINDVNGVSLYHLPYLIILMAYLCSQRAINVKIQYLKFDWSIYRLFVLNRGWKCVSLQMIIFVYDCPTWRIVELKTRFETWITRNDVIGVSLFNLSYLITINAYLSSQGHQNPNQVFYILLLYLQTICA